MAWIAFWVPFILVGKLLNPETGAWWGAVTALVPALIFWFLGDRLILALLRAKDLGRDRRLKNKKNNYCYLLKMNPAEIYESAILGTDVLVVQGPAQRQLVILGGDLLKFMDQTQIDALLLVALSRFKTPRPRATRLAALLYCPYVVLIALCERFLGVGLTTSFLSFFSYPSTLIHQGLINFINKEEKNESDSLEGFPEISHVYSALYNLRLLREPPKNRIFLNNYLKSFSVSPPVSQLDIHDSRELGAYGRPE